MTKLTELIALADAATPGPWEWTSCYAGPEDEYGCATRGSIDVHTFESTGFCANPELYAGEIPVLSAGSGEYTPYESSNDAAFIAAANPATVKRMAELLVQCREALLGANKAVSHEHVTLITEDALAALDAFEKEGK